MESDSIILGTGSANPSKAHSSSLLKYIQWGQYETIGALWESWASHWKKNFVYYNVLESIEKCQRYNGMARGPANTAAVLEQLREILKHETNELRFKSMKIDLFGLAFQELRNLKESKHHSERKEIAWMLVGTICQLYPKTPFESPSSNGTQEHGEILSVFQYTAISKSEKLLDIILDGILAGFEGDSVTYLGTEAPKFQASKTNGTGNGKTPSRMAKEKNSVEVGQLLYEALTSLPQGVRDKVANKIKGIVEKKTNLLNEAIWEIAVIAVLTEVVYYLFVAKSERFSTEAHAAFVINKGTVAIWNMLPEHIRRSVVSAPDVHLLRKMVSPGKADMLEAILKLEPALMDSIVDEKDYEILLQHVGELKNSSVSEGENAFYEAIRGLFVCSMIRNQNLGIQDIRDILERSKVEAYEMSFHFPLFKSDINRGSFADYVQGLKTMKVKFFRFERVLKYAFFPELSVQVPFMSSEDMNQDHREVMDAFDWLESQGVEEVMSLTVNDRLYCPHADEDVTACVNTLGVRILKWRKLDTYLKNMTDISLEELHLYSSGNRSVHDQWLSQLPRFKKLKKLCVYVVKDVIRPRLIKQVTEDLESDLNELNKIQGYPWTSDEEDTRHPKIKVSRISWIGQTDTAIGQSPDNRASDILSSRLTSFVKKFCGYYRDHTETKKTKVALIDSGVVVVGGRRGENANDDIFSTLAHRIVEGISLVSRDDEEHTWWHATEPHGTQMAALICTLNPFCDLFVVKVAESNASGITGHNVARAIEWARSKGVDVISLSLVTFSDPDKRMFEAIKAAKEDDIVIICSTADEGSIGAHSVGENSKNAISIAACDRWGNLLPQSQKTGFDYQFLGHNVHVGQVPFLESLEIIEGSSVSTAIAAGMASLILACARLSSTFLDNDLHEEDGRRRSWRCDTVKKRFDSMSEGKWVVLDNLCGQGELKKGYDFKRLVDDSFKRL
ncbi:hypothetical protein V8C42DRAFT_309254 [Trichoderma barbatum]